MDYDVVVVGAGPAGLFASRVLADNRLKILVIDKGKDITDRQCSMPETDKCLNCEPCDVMCGVGGAGTFSDGTLNLRPDVGGNLQEFTADGRKAWDLVDEVDKLFIEYGVADTADEPKDEEIQELKRRAASVGVDFVEIRQRHIGSDFTPEVIRNLKEDLVGRGVEFLLEREVADLLIRDNSCHGAVLKDGTKVSGNRVLVAPGRVGSAWMEEVVRKHAIDAKFGCIDIGVRVEVPSIVMDWVTRTNRDPKFRIRTSTYDDPVRTFCTNHRGFVVKETYNHFIGVNGHSLKGRESNNTNFALLVSVFLTEPIENTNVYGECVARLATNVGGGRPIVQRMGDLRRGQRSTPARLDRNPVENTLKDVTPGDIAMALPHRIVTDIIEGLKLLDRIVPGVAADSTLLYAPEMKFYAMRLGVGEKLQTSVSNLFAAGDGTGLSRDLVNAAATGLLAARGILSSL